MALKLKVNEAMQDDVNKGIVRLDSQLMRQLDIHQGNIVEIKGSRVTYAIADRSLPGDIGLNIIRMDGLIRRNARTSIGEMVDVDRADVKEAKKIVIAPARKGIMVRAEASIFKKNYDVDAITGDIIKDVGATTLPYTGLFWGKAGETVSMKGTTNESGGGTIITNDFNGATFNLADGMDIDMFVDLLNRKQAEKSVWEGF